MEILNEQNGISYIFGHSEDVRVQVGQQVNPGDILGDTGWYWQDPGTGEEWGHVHYEARVMCPGASVPTIVDPIAASSVQSKDEAYAMFC